MEKQVYKAKVVWIPGIAAVLAVTAFVIINDYSANSKTLTLAVIGLAAVSVKICFLCFGLLGALNIKKIPHLVELRKVSGQERSVILAASNETAEHLKNFAAAGGVNC